MSQIRHAKEVQHLQRRGLRLTLRLAVAEAVGHGGQQVLPDAIVHPHLHIVDDAHIVVQPDILEGTGDAHAADLMGGLARRWHPIDEDAAPGGLIDAGEEVKDRGLPGSVGADQSGDLRAADGESEVIHGGQTAEIDAQSAGLQHGGVADITLRHQRAAGVRDQRRIRQPHTGSFQLFHFFAASFFVFSFRILPRLSRVFRDHRPFHSANCGEEFSSIMTISSTE